jgi:predicted MFS family arabinose efflux permease
MDGAPAGDRSSRRLLVALAAAGVATFGQLYALQGLLPEISRDLGVGASSIGLTISAATFGLASALLPWAAVASRIGLPRAMTLALSAASGIGILVALAPSFPALVVLRLFEGIALGGVPALAVALASGKITSERRGAAVGIYIAGTTIGGLAGRLLASAVATVSDWRWAELAVCAIAVTGSVVFAVLVPRARVERRARRLRLAAVREVLPRVLVPPLRLRYAQAFLLMGSFVSVYSFLSFRLQVPPFGLAASVAGLVFLAYLAGTATSAVAGAVVARVGSGVAFLAATAVMLAAILVSLSPSLPVIIAALVLFTGAFFLAHSVASAAVVATARTDSAVASSFYNVAYYAGSAVLGGVGGLAFAGGAWGAIVVMVGTAIAVAAIIELVRRD